MEVDEIQRQVCKFQKIGNGSSNGTSNDARKVVEKGEIDQPHDGRYYPDDEEDGVLVKRGSSTGGCLAGGIDILDGGGGRLYGWPSSRIVRVSRASGGKDRHSKVLTSKGLRDRRVRLSVTTAIQFYDLQDRLGYDQPSKAVEWLLKAASSSIAELPSLNPAFPDTPKQLSDEKRSNENTEPGFESTEVELDGDPSFQHHQQGQNQNVSLSKSACSSTSETSKGSGLSLSRSESRIKARERARERAAEKEKEKENDSSQQGVMNHQNLSPISQNSSFTELLTAGINSVGGSNSSPNGSAHQNSGGGGGGNGGESSMVNKSRGQWTPPMDYLSTGIFAPLSSRGHTSSGFPGHIQLGNSLPHFNISTPTGDHHHHHHPELQHFSFVPENFVPASGNSESYNLNFSISSSGLAGFNRGTLQSNSPSLLPPHIQRFSSIDGSNLPFFIGSSTTAASNATASVENHHHHHNQHHQLPAGFDAGLQLCYGDNPAGRHSDHKGKGKN